MSSIDDYVENNRAYAASFADSGLEAAPKRRVAIVTCMDARLEVGALLGLERGGAHVIRNAGALVTDDVIRSLAISQSVLGTREIMVIGHTQCGLLVLAEEELAEAIERQAASRPTFELGAFSDLEGELRRGLRRLRTSPLLAYKNDIRGFVYEVESGSLREVLGGPPAVVGSREPKEEDHAHET